MDDGDVIKIGYSCEDWERHYETNDLGWDLGEVAPPFVHLWEERKISPGRAIIPGCGCGHEAIFLAEQGFQITALDYTRGALGRLEKALIKKNLSGELLRQDFFQLDSEYNNSFDLMLENTFFCAINPAMRQNYVSTAARILKTGALLVGLFYETDKEGGPPFNTRKSDIEESFSEQFAIEVLSKTPYSAEQRQGKEWLGIFKKNSPAKAS